jgi:hypothetical protein
VKKRQGKAVIIEFWGKDDFRAIRLPKQGSIKFESFKFYSFSNVSQIEVWEVKSLLIMEKLRWKIGCHTILRLNQALMFLMKIEMRGRT